MLLVPLRPRLLWLQELLVSPHLLVQHSIPVVRVVQYPGEFIINYPGAPQDFPRGHLADKFSRYIMEMGWEAFSHKLRLSCRRQHGVHLSKLLTKVRPCHGN